LVVSLLNLKTALQKLDSGEITKAVNILQDFTQENEYADSINTILKNRLIGEYDEAILMIDELVPRLFLKEAVT